MAHHRQPSQFGGGGQPHLGYGGPPMQQMQQVQQQPTGSKRSRPHDELELDMGGLQDEEMESMAQPSMVTPQGMGPRQSIGGYGQVPPPQQQQHHHHRLPETGPPSKMPRRGEMGESSMMSQGGAPSVVGQAGMPDPAPRPRGPKLKFTPEDDQLLVDLKENKSLTWKQIAEFFPGRSSGTLQVRYCTKLKAKTTQWTDETVNKLRTALQDYEQEKWRIVANKVGTGFTPAACREKAEEL